MTRLAPDKRGISMVFQSYALFPHLSVAENIVFGLQRARHARRRSARRGSTHGAELRRARRSCSTASPQQLSGGQRQRVALARAVVAETSICLMDEPLSNLDAQLRHGMRREIRALQQRLGMTVVYVTHDQVEAMSMADQRRADARRPHRAGRHAGGALCAAGHDLRGALHRHAGDELCCASCRRARWRGDARRAGPGRCAGRGAGLTLGMRPEHVALTDSGGVPARLHELRVPRRRHDDDLRHGDAGEKSACARQGNHALPAGTARAARLEPPIAAPVRYGQRRCDREVNARRPRGLRQREGMEDHVMTMQTPNHAWLRWRAAPMLAALVGAAAARRTEMTFYYPIAVGGPLTKVIDGYCAEFEQREPAASRSGRSTRATTTTRASRRSPR